MPPLRKYCGLIIGLQFSGVVLVLVGSGASALVQIAGLGLLLPGSLVAAVLPLQKLWHPLLWRLWQTDSIGFSNLLYLPVVVILNLVVAQSIRVAQRHSAVRQLP
jgi:hypothetical protein